MRWRIVPILVLCSLPPAARAQDEYRPSDALKMENSLRPPDMVAGRSNPATEYFRIWDTLSLKQRRELGEAAGMANPEPGVTLDKNSRRLCEEHRDYIDALIRNASAGACDWGLRRDVGWGALMPHLGLMRASLRIIRMDAWRCLDDKNYRGAAERIAAMIRMSDQMRSDRKIISTLVGMAICAVAVQMAERMVKDNQFTPALARIVLAAIGGLGRDDLFGCSEALEGERVTTVVWMREHYKGEHAGRLFMPEASLMGGDSFNNLICGMNEQQLNADLDRFDKFFDAAAAAWKRPDSTVLLWELDLEVWEGQYGLVARVMSPSMHRYAVSYARIHAQVDHVGRELQEIVTETPAPGPVGAK